MIGSKVWEVKVRKIETLAEVYLKGDRKIHSWIERGIFAYNHFRKVAHLFFFDFLPSYIYELSIKLKDYLAKRYYSADGQFRGRRILRDNGSVSAFLQNITAESPDQSHRKA
jgi:hypothetical protein